MPFNPQNAVDAAWNIINGPRTFERTRLDNIKSALRSNVKDPTVEIPDKAPPIMRKLAVKSRTNVLPLVLDVFSQVMRVDGYRSASNPDTDAPPWQTWQANRLMSRQVGVHRTALAYGAAYVIVTPGDPRPKLQGVSPRRMTAVYEDPVNDDYPMMALYVDGPMVRLYDETSVYYIGIENVAPRSGLVPDWWYTETPLSGYKFIERRDHNLGVCPVVRFRDRMLLDGEEVFGIIEPLISMQQRIDETVFGLLTAQYFAAFKQRYVIGWIPQNEGEKLKASAAEFWAFKDSPDQVKVGEFTETDLTRYLDSKDSAIGDLAAVAQVPAQALGSHKVSNISAEALAALQDGKDRKTDEITDSFGESWKQVLQLSAHAEGDDVNAQDDTAQVHWQDGTARSLAQTVDALGKMAALLDVPKQALWGRIPGVNQTDVQEWKELAQQGDALGNLTALLNDQSSTPLPQGESPTTQMQPGLDGFIPPGL
jgi:hypothetical protein